MPLLKHKLSPIYEKILNSTFLQVQIPEEKFCTCFECPQSSNESLQRYKTKCCDYHPIVPNYMVGAILHDKRNEYDLAKKIIKQKINDKTGNTIYGIVPPAEYRISYKKNRKGIFTLNPELLCPFYKSGNCTIWEYRSDICGFFHCLPCSGKSGKRFWNLSHKWLNTLEDKIVLFVLQKVYKDTIELNSNWRELVTLHNNDTFYNDYSSFNVNKYFNNEEQFYINCYKQAIKLSDNKQIFEFDNNIQNLIKLGKELAVEMNQNIIPNNLVLDIKHPEWKEMLYRKGYKYYNTSYLLRDFEIEFLTRFDGKISTKTVIHQAFIKNIILSTHIQLLLKMGVLRTVLS